MVKDYADTRFFANFRAYLRENETFRETVFACLHGAQVEFFDKKCRKSRDTVPLIKLNSLTVYVVMYAMLAAPGSLLLKTGSVHFMYKCYTKVSNPLLEPIIHNPLSDFQLFS